MRALIKCTLAAVLLSGGLNGQAVSTQTKAKAEPPDKLVQAVEYLDTCGQEEGRSLTRAKEWCVKACDTAKGFRSKDPDKRAAAGRFLAECDKKIKGLDDREDFLKKEIEAFHKAVAQKKLSTAQNHIEDAHAPTEDSRFNRLRAELQVKLNARDAFIQMGDDSLQRKPKKSLKFYRRALGVDKEKDLSSKMARASEQIRLRKQRWART